MSQPFNALRFSRKDQPEFYKTLRKRVNEYFKDQDLSKHANNQMIFKSVFMICLFFVPYGFMISGTLESSWAFIGMWGIMGFGMAGIGLSVMHDANHGAYSQKNWVNTIMGHTSNIVGANSANWKIQHNTLHHTYTNVDEYDEDLDSLPILRFSPNKEKKAIHKGQFIYAWFFYGLLTLSWVTIKEYSQLTRFYRKGLINSKSEFNKLMLELILWKVIYYSYILVLPLVLMPERAGLIVGGFFLLHFIAGVVLSTIFQLAHVMPEANFPTPSENLQLSNDWAVHQMLTTSNFARNGRLFSWFVGGLNYQIEHHLFPTICHVHYKNLAPIVQETAEEFNIPYHSHKTFVGGLYQHGKMLHKLGRE